MKTKEKGKLKKEIKDILETIFYSIVTIVILIVIPFIAIKYKSAKLLGRIVIPAYTWLFLMIIYSLVMNIYEKKYITKREVYHKGFGKIIFEYDSKKNTFSASDSQDLFKDYHSKIQISDFDEINMAKYINSLGYVFYNNENIVNNLKNLYSPYCNSKYINLMFKIEKVEIITYEEVKKYIDEIEALGVTREGINDLKKMIEKSSPEQVIAKIETSMGNLGFYAIAYVNDRIQECSYCCYMT